jgi:hypothetical protein
VGITRLSFAVAAAAAGAAMLLATAPAAAQQPVAQQPVPHAVQECPAAEPGTTPVELRIAGMVLRAQVKTEGGAAPGDSTRVEARLVSCEEDRRIAADEDVDHPLDAAAASAEGLLRVLSDLRLGIQLTPSADGRCFRAQLDVRDDGPTAARGTGLDGPLGIELCGLPVYMVRAKDPEAGS